MKHFIPLIILMMFFCSVPDQESEISTPMAELKNDIPSYKLRSDELNDVFKQAKNEINSSDRAQITALIIAGSRVEGF